MEEEWRYIPGFDNLYMASNLGNIKSFKKDKIKGKLMTGTTTKDGRKRVNLNNKKYLVHRLILMAFKPEEENEENCLVLHLDGDPTNNKLENLKWGSYTENANDKLAIERNKQTQRESKEKREKDQELVYKDEIWKDIPNYDGLYQISNYGRVKSFKKNKEKGHIMSLISQTGSNYYTIGLSKNNYKKHYSIDQLVAQAFLENPNNYTEVNHIDENGYNNHISNLEWCSHSKNVQHSIYRQSVPICQYTLDDVFIKKYNSIAEASRINNFPSRQKIKKVLNKNIEAYGYFWRIDER